MGGTSGQLRLSISWARLVRPPDGQGVNAWEGSVGGDEVEHQLGALGEAA